MACASHTSLVIMLCFKEHVEEITFNKDLLTVPQDFQGFCKIFCVCLFIYFFFKERKKINHLKENHQYKIPTLFKCPTISSAPQLGAVAWMETPWGWRWRSEALPCHAARCCASGRWFARQVTFMHGCSFCFVLGAPGLLVAVSWVGFQSNCSGESSSRGLAISP